MAVIVIQLNFMDADILVASCETIKSNLESGYQDIRISGYQDIRISAGYQDERFFVFFQLEA